VNYIGCKFLHFSKWGWESSRWWQRVWSLWALSHGSLQPDLS